ncbi:MAG TPA: rhomboid family intramembrane serine protease, partial [Vicinamibacterales bacterium]|nr:rhomboid family intramembrane serine protease [Vicinamibacterales bacterium]
CPSCGSLVGVRDDRCFTCGRANPGLWGFGPALRKLGADLGFVSIVIGACSALYVLTLLVSAMRGELEPIGGGLMSILPPSQNALLIFGMSGGYPVFRFGMWWTVLSASWLHGNFLHILFNMMWVRDLAPATADVIGPARTVVIYTISGACGFLLSSAAFTYFALPIPVLRGAPFTMGASASIFGLLGALWHYGRMSGSSYIRGQAGYYAALLFFMGLIMPGVDNYAHAGGFIGGYLMSAFFNPLTRERGDHTLMAVACLLATLLAIVFSALYVLRIV